jgi:dTDP-4-dehydrorhamnose 3,5-epimerase
MNVYQGTLLAQDESSIYIPAGCATGWISLVDNTSLLYFMSARYEDSLFSGFRFDDPLITIKWPRTPQLISEQDRNWPSLKLE